MRFLFPKDFFLALNFPIFPKMISENFQNFQSDNKKSDTKINIIKLPSDRTYKYSPSETIA